MADIRLNPPIVDSIIPAQVSKEKLTIPFMMNRSVGWADFDKIQIIVKTAQTNVVLATSECSKTSLYLKNNIYYADFNGNFPFKEGQYYKIQLAYLSATENVLGFYSTAATFKFTFEPSVSIQNLTGNINNHIYNYTGVYSNIGDSSEKVYSYCFELYSRDNTLLATTGELLHNSSTDKSTTESTDSWTIRYALEPGLEYLLVYKVKTINGLECTSPTYKIIDGQSVPSNIFKYYDFIAVNNTDSACVELSLQPKKNVLENERKLINGKFVLTRSSSEDNFSSWQEMTRFILASWDSSKNKFICKDYSVSQGVEYKYGLQAYNSKGVYTTREETPLLQVDFEDMFLSDGQRQLRIRFNPKVTSFKTTLLESKMDTLGGKYPFFFRNGNVNYKEFPISGLISILMDENDEFVSGISFVDKKRSQTPAKTEDWINLKTSLTSDNFQKERSFKMQVLEWLTNGKPKLFRSPGEGSFIVRLMNTSLSPNDTLGRMLHTFSSTAYEMADFSFENLREYGMLMDEYIETRDLITYTKDLYAIEDGHLEEMNACLATVHAYPGTKFYFKLKYDTQKTYLVVGPTGVYNFSSDVLAENPLVEIGTDNKNAGWFPEASLIYSEYKEPEIDTFSHVESIDINDRMAQWIGNSQAEIPSRFATYELKSTIGLIYYLNVQKRDIIIVDSATKQADRRTHTFVRNGVNYTPSATELVYCKGKYYDGRNTFEITEPLDFSFQLRSDEDKIDLNGVGSFKTGNPEEERFNGVTSTSGRIVLSNLSDVDMLFLGNGVYADIAYQEINKTYVIENTLGSDVQIAKDKWDKTPTEENYINYYNKLKNYLERQSGGLIIDAIG